MNMFKKTGGFTLVELIVVIAILAILAAVAVPAYSGYIKKAEQAGDLTILDAAKTAAMGALATEPGSVNEVAIAADGKVTAKTTENSTGYSLSVAADGVSYDDDFKAFNNDSATVTGLEYYASATWTAENGWTGVEKSE